MTEFLVCMKLIIISEKISGSFTSHARCIESIYTQIYGFVSLPAIRPRVITCVNIPHPTFLLPQPHEATFNLNEMRREEEKNENKSAKRK